MQKNQVSPATLQMFTHNRLIAKKTHKGNTDAKQIASKQEYEMNYVSYHYGIPKDVVLAVMKALSTTRRTVIYDALRLKGYVIEFKNRRR